MHIPDLHREISNLSTSLNKSKKEVERKEKLLKKLQDRKERGKLNGSGDYR